MCVYCCCSNAAAPVLRAEVVSTTGLRQLNKINAGGKVSWILLLLGFFCFPSEA